MIVNRQSHKQTTGDAGSAPAEVKGTHRRHAAATTFRNSRKRNVEQFTAPLEEAGKAIFQQRAIWLI
jgi:hypothetical protein